MNVLVLNGPNLNRLGEREVAIYGRRSLTEIEAGLAPEAGRLGVQLEWVQSNHEGALIDRLEERSGWADGALLNAGALTHTSYALADAVRAFGKPVVEVHLSNVHARERWRRRSVLAPACAGGVYGFGADSYRVGLEALVRLLAPEEGAGRGAGRRAGRDPAR
ncbi:MAG TPA: type II 3-dehydroquinate dehydratase [Gemmatimonadota bacterium]|nr:type II 3-dehydroquinate dehydratase [Gemmatimonadota bacterium]